MIREMLNTAVALGHSLRADYESFNDYSGYDVQDCINALNACDEMELRIVDRDGEVIGWALYIPELEADEQIADCSGWCAEWLEDSE